MYVPLLYDLGVSFTLFKESSSISDLLVNSPALCSGGPAFKSWSGDSFCGSLRTSWWFFFIEGPRSRYYGRTAASRHIEQPYEEDDDVFLLFHCKGPPVECN
jgi:hypothetical protein